MTITDEDLRSAVQGTMRLALVEVVAVEEGEVSGRVLQAIEGELAGILELVPTGMRAAPRIALGQHLLVAVSPFRHRTSKLALMRCEVVSPGDDDEVATRCRKRLLAIKAGL